VYRASPGPRPLSGYALSLRRQRSRNRRCGRLRMRGLVQTSLADCCLSCQREEPGCLTPFNTIHGHSLPSSLSTIGTALLTARLFSVASHWTVGGPGHAHRMALSSITGAGDKWGLCGMEGLKKTTSTGPNWKLRSHTVASAQRLAADAGPSPCCRLGVIRRSVGDAAAVADRKLGVG
jgi:hypothetical protein